MNDAEAALVRTSLAHGRAGTIPFGFDLADDGTTLVFNGGEQDTIGDMRDMQDSGMTLREIALALTERGVPTKTGKANWRSNSVIARILSRTY